MANPRKALLQRLKGRACVGFVRQQRPAALPIHSTWEMVRPVRAKMLETWALSWKHTEAGTVVCVAKSSKEVVGTCY